MQFIDVVRSLATSATVPHAQAAIRAEHGKRAARWLAGQAGISRRTARRWLSSAFPASRAAQIIGAASTLGLAAQRFRTATAIDVGTVSVDYDDDNQGNRRIGENDVDDEMAGYLHSAANDLENGNLEAAAEAFSNAIVNGYESGLEETLTISDYSSGIAFA
jgi:hypothetical protein